jgi:AbrB family looped-hinge helix DNA binding protein
MSPKECRPFYGAVTVSDRGQIVIPAEARRDLGIEIGEKLLVVGGPSNGLVLIRANLVGQMINQWSDVIRVLGEAGINAEGDIE